MGNGDPPWVIPGEFAGNKQVVIKSSGAIHISNDITLLQRRAWNVLLAHAYDELPIKEEHSIKISKLVNILNYESTNIKYLKETLKALVDTKVEWNLLGRDGKEVWGVAALLAQVELESHRGTCTYAYAPAIRKRLYNPAIYAKVNLWLQNKFSSKHTLALYECCVDWYNVNSKCGETPWIPIPVLRKSLGVPDGAHQEFKKFNGRVIKKAIEEINAVSDLHASVKYKRQGRNVDAAKFIIKKNPASSGQIKAIESPTDSPQPQIDMLLRKIPEVYRDDPVMKSQLRKHLETEGFDYVFAQIHYTNLNAGKIRETYRQYLISALKANYGERFLKMWSEERGEQKADLHSSPENETDDIPAKAKRYFQSLGPAEQDALRKEALEPYASDATVFSESTVLFAVIDLIARKGLI